MRQFHSIACGIALVLMILSSGCADNKNGIQGVAGKDATEMNAARSEFEKSGDPPLTAQTHFAAGQLNETQGQIPLAIEQYEASLKLDPKYVPSLFRLAFDYSQIKQYPQAIAAWQRYIDATDHSAIGYSNLAYCQELSGDPGSAEQSYESGIEREPSNQPCRVNFGLMLARQGRIDEAKAQFGAVLSPAESLYNIASVLEQQGKKDEAKAQFQEAVKSDPKLIDAQTRLAELEKN
jgi:tetratricopeptide (TPR) repeat protein